MWASGQGGLLDVVADKSFAQNRTIYFCFAERANGGGRTAVARARLNDGKGRLDEVKIIFRQQGPLSSGNHYGCRIAQADDGNLFVTLGEHFTSRDQAQTLGNHLGKVIRIAPDGSVPSGNPFAGRADAKPEIWSYGHRNAQGLAIHPASGELWEIEHGPRGGDEVNLIGKGKNYGWPVIGYGIDYSGAKIHDATAKDGMEQPLKYWVPSIAPSGMAFYTGKLFPKWNGSLFTGALRGAMLVRLTLNGNTRDGGGTPAAEPARAYQGRPPGAGRRAVAADGQFERTGLAGGAGREVTISIIVAAPSPGAANSPPFVKDQKRADGDEQKTERVIPAQRLLQIQHREAGEHHQRDHLLHGLELRRRIDRAAPAVGRHRQPVFEEGDPPARQDDAAAAGSP